MSYGPSGGDVLALIVIIFVLGAAVTGVVGWAISDSDPIEWHDKDEMIVNWGDKKWKLVPVEKKVEYKTVPVEE